MFKQIKSCSDLILFNIINAWYFFPKKTLTLKVNFKMITWSRQRETWSILKGLLRKNLRGKNLKPKRSWSRPWWVLLDVPVLRNWYKTVFLETGTSDRTHECRDQLLKCLGFSLYPLLIFQNSPFNVFEHCYHIYNFKFHTLY